MPATKWANLIYRVRIKIPFGVARLERHPEIEMIGRRPQTGKAYMRLLHKHHVLGSAALLKDGQDRMIILSSSRSPEHRVKLKSVFRVASITKMAASLSALIFVERGLLSMDTPVNEWLQDFGNIPELGGITLSHLLSHTSGIKDPAGLEQSLLREVPFPDFLSECRFAEPGTVFRYSNLGFGIVGCLLEAVSHKPVSQVLKETVFNPLQMNATLDASTLDPSDIVPIKRIYRGSPQDLTITPLGRIPLDKPDPLRHYGHTAGAMYLDLESLEKLVDCLKNEGKPLLHTDIGKKMRCEHASYGSLSPTLSYGLGLIRIQDPSISQSIILGHQGFAYGCADGAFWEADTGKMILFLNGGASEARSGRLGLCNRDLLRWALRKEFPLWSKSSK